MGEGVLKVSPPLPFMIHDPGNIIAELKGEGGFELRIIGRRQMALSYLECTAYSNPLTDESQFFNFVAIISLKAY